MLLVVSTTSIISIISLSSSMIITYYPRFSEEILHAAQLHHNRRSAEVQFARGFAVQGKIDQGVRSSDVPLRHEGTVIGF